MAIASHICLVFLALMILSNEFVSVEARNLKQRKDSKFVKVQLSRKTIAGEAMVLRFASPSQLHYGVKEREGYIKAFRPMISGSRPGVGHSIYDKELEGYIGAFRPTTPGHSPGVGHSIHN